MAVCSNCFEKHDFRANKDLKLCGNLCYACFKKWGTSEQIKAMGVMRLKVIKFLEGYGLSKAFESELKNLFNKYHCKQHPEIIMKDNFFRYVTQIYRKGVATDVFIEMLPSEYGLKLVETLRYFSGDYEYLRMTSIDKEGKRICGTWIKTRRG